jgi:hypothetical protein
MLNFIKNKRLLRIKGSLCLSLYCLQGLVPSYADSPQLGEYQLKAVYLYNFTKFVTWPTTAFSSPDAPFQICVLGDDPFRGMLEAAVKDEKVKGRKIIAQHIDDMEMIKECHTLFISRSEQSHLTNILNFAKLNHTLTVSDIEDFIPQGGMIQFYRQDDNKIRFAIDPKILDAVGLKASSELLKLAKIIRR